MNTHWIVGPAIMVQVGGGEFLTRKSEVQIFSKFRIFSDIRYGIRFIYRVLRNIPSEFWGQHLVIKRINIPAAKRMNIHTNWD